MIVNTTKSIINLTNAPLKKEKYNILTFPTHERYESQLCKTGHNFYSFHMSDLKKWNKEQVPVPSNYYILPENDISGVEYDFILSQSKFWQFQIAIQINQQLNLPVISLEHTLPTPNVMQRNQIESMKSMTGHFNVFISEFSKNAWGFQNNGIVIHHGIDTDTFKPLPIQKTNNILTVANDFVNRDYCLNYSGWKRITQGHKTRLVGDTKGLSVSAKSIEDLAEEYNKCKIYLNTSTLSPIPTSLLEAMSCGCAVVSTATCMIPEIIENGVNGFISNSEDELREYIDLLMNDDDLRAKMSINARKTIEDKFAQEKFVQTWNNLFDHIYEVCRK